MIGKEGRNILNISPKTRRDEGKGRKAHLFNVKSHKEEDSHINPHVRGEGEKGTVEEKGEGLRPESGAKDRVSRRTKRDGFRKNHLLHREKETRHWKNPRSGI